MDDLRKSTENMAYGTNFLLQTGVLDHEGGVHAVTRSLKKHPLP